ncbi:hypothetical protein ABPG74_001917, partial [Tetrahymena malaccensis]
WNEILLKLVNNIVNYLEPKNSQLELKLNTISNYKMMSRKQIDLINHDRTNKLKYQLYIL